MSRIGMTIGFVWALACSSAPVVGQNLEICDIEHSVKQEAIKIMDEGCVSESAPFKPTDQEIALYEDDQIGYYDDQIACQQAINTALTSVAQWEIDRFEREVDALIKEAEAKKEEEWNWDVTIVETVEKIDGGGIEYEFSVVDNVIPPNTDCLTAINSHKSQIQQMLWVLNFRRNYLIAEKNIGWWSQIIATGQ